MSESVSLIPVPVGACRCPGSPHEDGDTVFLYPKLGLDAGIAVQSAVQTNDPGPGRLAAAYQALIDHNIADWNITNGDGSKLPIDKAHIRAALPWMEGGKEVADKLLIMHQEAVLAPLRGPAPAKPTRPTKSSRRGQTSVTST